MPASSETLPRHKRIKKVEGIQRALFRLPILLYRLGLGWLLGQRFLKVTHQGRLSGKWREAVIEVADQDASKNEYYCVAAWGHKANWWLNLQKNPRCWVHVGRQHFEAISRSLSEEESEDIFLDYAHAHPATLKSLAGFMGFQVDGSDEQYRKLAHSVPVVGFRPAAQS